MTDLIFYMEWSKCNRFIIRTPVLGQEGVIQGILRGDPSVRIKQEQTPQQIQS